MKVTYDNITFDSELEVKYYQHLKKLNLNFIYHPYPSMQLSGRKYTPDFIVFYNSRIEIIETKGYNQFSFMADNMIHAQMKQKTENELRDYLKTLDLTKCHCVYDYLNVEKNDFTNPIFYKKIKYLKSLGFVNFDFKNPNSVSNKRKVKIEEQKEDIKELKKDNKILLQYAKYTLTDKKLTKKQAERLQELIVEIKINYLQDAKEETNILS